MIHQHSTTDLYADYKALLQKIADIRYAVAVLQWDQETYMPVNGATARARQIATLSEMAHQLFTNGSTGDLLQELTVRLDLPEDGKKNVELSLYDYSKQKRLPGEFVRELSEVTSRSFQSWLNARKMNAFSLFEEDLGKLVALKQQEADLLGFEGHPYDALLNDYERGCTTALLERTFAGLRRPLQKLIDAIRVRPQVNDSFLHGYFPHQLQWNYGMGLLKQLGFDMQAGRQDLSEHPFTTNFSSSDVRITTRVDEKNFTSMTWSCIHELGHALYEQGLPDSEYGLPLGEYASLSIHESQSRLWENNVGRSFPFWQFHYHALQQYFPTQLGAVSIEDFYRGINKVAPSLVRTEADELTYHFHVMIRYELEKSLLEKSITTADVPAFWNEKYVQYLGVEVPDHKQGVLQDVHWSHGSFGYFPTYSLGSLYAAQFYHAARQQVPGLEEDIRNGRTAGLLNWLRTNIHAKGRRLTSEQLCQEVSGEPLLIDYYLQYANEKYQDIYKFVL